LKRKGLVVISKSILEISYIIQMAIEVAPCILLSKDCEGYEKSEKIRDSSSHKGLLIDLKAETILLR
jgi:hypothetical protein